VRASRLLSALLLLQAHGRMSARALAAALDVSVRTVYRDMTALHAAGVPVYAEGGPAGGYQLVNGFRTRLTGLTEDEARVLFLTGLPGPAAELGLGALVSAAELKLAAALPPSLLDNANRVRSRFHLDAPGWYTDGDASPHLSLVADALWQQRRIRVRYRRWKEPTDVHRTLDPLGLVVKAGIWYLVAIADGGNSPRTYRVNQILGLEVTGERFERLSTFDLRDYWTGYLSDYRNQLHQGEAVVRFSPKALERLPDQVSHEVRAAVESTGTADGTGWVTATVPIESLIHAEGQFLRFGAEVEVLRPARLRSRLTATARGLADLYAPRATAGSSKCLPER
jgi:predicted DNA-binding transcriptional regulator YafY